MLNLLRGSPDSAQSRPVILPGDKLTNVAIVGCGYVADFYMATLPNHPRLHLWGVFDWSAERLATFSRYHRVNAYPSLAALLADPKIDLVLNLTNPSSHFEVSSAALRAGKHVYSEKPLTLDIGEAQTLVNLAKANRLHIGAAPATLLGETAEAVQGVIAAGDLGTVRVVYAELDDGMVHQSGCERWRSVSGAPWPWQDEFATGCTLQHAGYYISWLCALFGSVTAVTAFASRQVDHKGDGTIDGTLADDFSVACLTFDNGVVARLTCGLLAPRDRSLRIVGDHGVLVVEDGWDTRSAVYLQSAEAEGRQGYHQVIDSLLSRVPAAFRRRRIRVRRAKYKVPDRQPGRLDYARGPAAMALAISNGTSPDAQADFTLHVTEVALLIARARHQSQASTVTTRI